MSESSVSFCKINFEIDFWTLVIIAPSPLPTRYTRMYDVYTYIRWIVDV